MTDRAGDEATHRSKDGLAGEAIGRTADRPAGGAGDLSAGAVSDRPESPEPLLSDGALLGLLVFDGVLLGLAGLAFTPFYVGAVPVPLGAFASIVLLPWLVGRAGEVTARPGWAAAPMTAWALTIGVLGLAGPGGDVLLPTSWQSLLLMFGGLGAGLWRLRRPDRPGDIRDR